MKKKIMVLVIDPLSIGDLIKKSLRYFFDKIEIVEQENGPALYTATDLAKSDIIIVSGRRLVSGDFDHKDCKKKVIGITMTDFQQLERLGIPTISKDTLLRCYHFRSDECMKAYVDKSIEEIREIIFEDKIK